MYKVGSTALNIKQKVQTILFFESTSLYLKFKENMIVPGFDLSSIIPAFLINNNELMISLNEKFLKFKEKLQTILGFEITSYTPIYIMTSESPMFEIKSYDERLPILANLLDFIEITGGKF
jgi:hypothetical protein